jgi:lipid-binding SYLF domain-containing protein
MNRSRRFVLAAAPALAAGVALPRTAQAFSAHELTEQGRIALDTLHRLHPYTREMAHRAAGVLVFPTIVKAGFLIGAETGNGVMFHRGQERGFYNISAASYGFQAGAQSFSYALFFMNEHSMRFLNESQGWAVGVGPSVVVADEGLARSMTSTTLTQDVYAFPFGEQGLMAGAGIEGSKITRIYPG